MNAIEVEALSKRYLIRHQGRSDTLRDAITHGVKGLWNRWKQQGFQTEEFWALKDINFAIKPGEVIGVVGRNGAGKSTLLKLLSRITEPTTGRITLKGRVASLLEVGTGFHPELSGRENIFLNGAILGMRRAEISRKFDEIVEFAEVNKFLDTPVKRYSSGMYIRLAFAVAAHLEPEVLIIDEVLAVGDMAFQKKCLGKINSVARNEGRTVLFVSHNMVAVQSLCKRVVLLQKGEVAFDGGAAEGVSKYLHHGGNSESYVRWENPTDAPSVSYMWIRSIQVAPELDSEIDAEITMQSDVTITTEFEVLDNEGMLHLTYHLINDAGIIVLTSGSGARNLEIGVHRATCKIPGNLLNSGDYQLRLLIVKDGSRVVLERDNVVAFSVSDRTERKHGWHGKEPGIIKPSLNWDLQKLSQ